MIRALLVSIVFFFGPMLAMFVLRNLVLLFRLWLEARRQRRMQPEVVDVTPGAAGGPSFAFVIVAILIGALSAYLAWQHTHQGVGNLDTQYVPAHLDDQGRMVPGRLVPKGGAPGSDTQHPR